jgi:hypothetical protein
MKILSLFVLLILSINLQASDPEKKSESKNASLNGQVVDIKTGEALVGVAITIDGETTYTDFEGKYEITNLKSGSYIVETTYIAYKQETANIKLKGNKKFDISLTVE